MPFMGSAGSNSLRSKVNRAPTWSTGATLSNIYDRGSRAVNLSASSPDGATVTYSLASGSLPSGMSLNTGTGAVTGTVGTFGSSTGHTFTINANVGNAPPTSRTFTLQVDCLPDGSDSAHAAASATILRNTGGIVTNGDYWIQPSGQTAYQIYCDVNSDSGGWMLVGSGREGREDNNASFRSWWLNAGNGTFNTELKAANLTDTVANRNPRYMPAAWVRAAAGGSTWDSVELLVNRVSTVGSFYYRTGTGTFEWSQFNPGSGVDSGSTAASSISVTGYSANWRGGTASTTSTGAGWPDYFPAGNDATRNFSWTWSGHRATVGQAYQGWSAGSSITTGFQVATEGHALQMVNIFVR